MVKQRANCAAFAEGEAGVPAAPAFHFVKAEMRDEFN